MRLIALLLIGLFVLPVWALGDNTISLDMPQTRDGSDIASPISATMIPPTTTLLPTSAAVPETAIPLSPTDAPAFSTPTLTASSIGTQSDSPTEAVTAAPTSAITSTASIVAPSREASQVVQPTNTVPLTETLIPPFPTVDLTAARIDTPTTMPMRVPLTLPALATMDDGAHDWRGTPNWSLQPHDNGLAWVSSDTGSGMVYWQTPISLITSANSVSLNFQSRFAGDGLAMVLVSRDALNWQSVSAVPASENWGNVSVDLSGYIGSVIYIGFSRQGGSAQTQSWWAIDTISIIEAVPTLSPPEPTGLPTATALQPSATLIPVTPAEPSPVVASTLEATVTPSQTESGDSDDSFTASPTASEVYDAPTSTAEPGDSPPIEQTEEIILVPEPTVMSTEGVQATSTATVAPDSIVCELDIDADGTLTEGDITTIGRLVLYTVASEQTSIYDLNGNQLIDIGDLQMMAGYLFEVCSAS